MCDCLENVNIELAEHNTKIVVPMWTASGRLTPFVETTKLDTKQRGKAKALFATFCPFCGERYEPLSCSPSSQDGARE